MKKQERYCCGHLWEQGSRLKNEDSLAFWQMSDGRKTRILGIICDGIGGLQEGENASGFVVRQSASWFVGKGCQIRGSRRIETDLLQLFFQLHEQLQAYGGEKGIKLGTAMTLFLIDDDYFYWAHCGDTRLYFFRRGKIRLMTRDHLEPSGALNRAIGVGSWKPPSTGRKRFKVGDKLLLCTDGFYRRLQSEDMNHLLRYEVFRDEQASRLLAQVGQRKLAMGERDNISALYCGKYRESRRFYP